MTGVLESTLNPFGPSSLLAVVYKKALVRQCFSGYCMLGWFRQLLSSRSSGGWDLMVRMLGGASMAT
jgi:hypothetical protein